MAQESRIQQALAALEAGDVPNVTQAANAFQVPRTTLRDRFKGKPTRAAAHQNQQRFSPAEEASIARAVHQMASWGWPMTVSVINNLANDLLARRNDTAGVGINWYQHFLHRNPHLKITRSRTLDQARRDAHDYKVLEEWFDLFHTAHIQYGVVDDDIYNMDEKGCMKGIGDNSKVIVPKEEAQATSNQPGNRDWVSIIECINTNNYVLPPFVIFKGQRIQQDWINASIDENTVIQVSPNGWTNNLIALEWLKHFDRHTAPRKQGKYRLLLFDGHTSHVSFDFIQFCDLHDIVALCLPPHATHILQPLDVGIFGPVAKSYRILIQKDSIFGATRINNVKFLEFYQKTRKGIAKNIPGAWRGCGLFPFNPQKVLINYRPKTPPFATFTDENGRSVNIQAGDTLAGQINTLVSQLLEVCPSPLKSGIGFIQSTALTALADRSTLQALNQGLVDKQLRARTTRTKKAHGQARILRVGEMRELAAERVVKETAAEKAKERRAIMRGIVGFTKMVYKELPMGPDVFQD
jgi:hypothetical protein